MIDFREIHPDFGKFNEFYINELEPQLQDLEKQRLTKLGYFKKWRLLAVFLGVGVAIAAFMVFHSGAEAILLGGIVGGISFGVAFIPLERLRGVAQKDVMPKIADSIGLSLTIEGFTPPDRELFEKYQLLPSSYHRAQFEDLLTGRRHGVEFDLYEAHLEKKVKSKNGHHWVTVFHGQLFRIAYPKAFLGETIVLRDSGFMNRFKSPGKAFKNVGLSSPRFEKAFEAWSTDQVEARDLLDPLVLERFLELERLYEGKGLCAAWVAGNLYIAMSTGDRMNMGSVFKPFNSGDRVETILQEFATVFDLVDIIAKPISGRRVDAFSVNDIRN